MRLLTFLLLLISFTCYAQDKDSVAFHQFMKQGNGAIASMPNDSGDRANASLRRAVDRYNEFIFDHHVNAYKWQLLSSKIIFFTVILIVLTGLWLSYLQLTHSMGMGKDAPATDTSIEYDTGSFKINTAVVGIIILIVSLAFFFLYLKFAFHIIDPGQISS